MRQFRSNTSPSSLDSSSRERISHKSSSMDSGWCPEWRGCHGRPRNTWFEIYKLFKLIKSCTLMVVVYGLALKPRPVHAKTKTITRCSKIKTIETRSWSVSRPSPGLETTNSACNWYYTSSWTSSANLLNHIVLPDPSGFQHELKIKCWWCQLLTAGLVL